MAADIQGVEEIRDAPEFVTSVEFKQYEQRLLANAAASMANFSKLLPN
jgi:hypothetical protein